MDLTPLMKPKSIGVIGASQRIGRATRVIVNLQRFGYAGRIYPINPKYTEILGLPCYPDLASTPEPPETVVVAIPGAEVPALLATAAGRGVRGAVILSSGFGEAGPAGRERQAALERLAERGLLICGPNCYGVLNVRLGAAAFSADFAEPPRPRAVALVSQSGGFSHALAEHLMRQLAVGLSQPRRSLTDRNRGNNGLAGRINEGVVPFVGDVDERMRAEAQRPETFPVPAGSP